jgi:protocatechuate 3,4-dioxygenase beta subunit
VLQRGSKVTGIVLDARTGRPVAGAAVEIAGGPPLRMGGEEFYVLPPIEDAEHWRVLGRATSGDDGRFVIDGVPPHQPLIVTARAANAFTGRAEGAAPPLDQDGRPVEVRIGPTGTLAGRVLDAAGAPVAGALVGAVPTSNPQQVGSLADGSAFDVRMGSADRRIVRIDGEGRWRIEGLPLDTVMTVVAKGPAAPSPPVGDVMLTAEHPERTLDLVVGGFGAVLVRILGPDGTPAGGGVGVETSHASWSNHEGTEHHFDRVVPGTRTVTVRAPGFPPVSLRVEVKAGETASMDVRLVPGHALVGTVTGPDGRPVAGAEVHAIGPDGAWAGAKSDAEGRFRLEGLPLGRHRVEANDETAGTGWADVEVVPDTPPIAVTIPKNGDLRVSVADAKGAPVVNAWVTMTGPVRRTNVAGEDGTFVQRLPPGRYRIELETGAGATSAVEVEVQGGEETSASLHRN